MRGRRGSPASPAAGTFSAALHAMVGRLGDQVALEAGRAASVGAASVAATLGPPLIFAFFAVCAGLCLTVAALIWLAGLYGWVVALLFAGGAHAVLALVVYVANGWRLSTPTVPAAAVAPVVAAAEAQGIAEGAAGVPPPGLGRAPLRDPALDRFERDLEIAMMAADAFRNGADIGRSLRGGGGRRRRRRKEF